MYKIEVTKRFERDFTKIPKVIQKQIISRVTPLAGKPYSEKRLHGTLKNYHSLRCGDYRVIFSINEAKKTVTLEHCGHRKKIYEMVN